MTTFEEQLDELLAMAADAGRLGAELQQAEKDRNTTLDRPRAGKRVREAKKLYTVAEQKLSGARRAFLGRYQDAIRLIGALVRAGHVTVSSIGNGATAAEFRVPGKVR